MNQYMRDAINDFLFTDYSDMDAATKTDMSHRT